MESLNAQDAAEFLKMSKASLLEKARRGDIPGAKLGKCWVFITEDLINLVRQHTNKKGEIIPCQLNDKKAVKFTTQTSRITAKELENLLEQR